MVAIGKRCDHMTMTTTQYTTFQSVFFSPLRSFVVLEYSYMPPSLARSRNSSLDRKARDFDRIDSGLIAASVVGLDKDLAVCLAGVAGEV